MEEGTVRSKMQEVLDMVVTDIGTIRTGRATPGLIEELEVSVYGGQQKLKINELATISAPDPETLTIDPWDKSIIGDIKQGILSANIGFNPSVDGEIIRISLPALTTEDRQKYVKLLSTKLESGRVMIRQVRSDAMRDIKKSFEGKELSEDEKFNQEKQLQDTTDEFVKKIDENGKKKEVELLRV